MYAVIESGNKQYRVSAGDTVQVERLPAEAGQTVTFDRVLLVSHEGKFTTGAPTVAQATVDGEVVEYEFEDGPKGMKATKVRRVAAAPAN